MRMDSNSEPGAEERRRDQVIIAAAVSALFGRHAAIRRVRAVPGKEAGAWLREGRLAIQASHRTAAPLIRAVGERAMEEE
jgi:hypothetical protein